MRIIAGNLGGRTFMSPRGHRTHPMSDRVRGGMFNVLGDMTGLIVLDAFAGSGALGFESASRGAERVVLIDEDRTACAAIHDNIRQLDLQSICHVIQASIQAWHRTLDKNESFDIILCDPPYDRTQIEVIAGLADRLMPDGVLALSWPGKQTMPVLSGLQVARHKTYGDAQLIFYRRLD